MDASAARANAQSGARGGVEEIVAFVDKHFDYFFEYWLFGWSTEPMEWPKRRTRRLFHEWFEVRVHTMVEDVVDTPYELEDL